MAEAKDIFKKVSSIGTGSSDKKQQKQRATISGAAIGAVFGMYYGYSKKKNVLIMGAAGALIGAIVTKMFMPK